MQYLTLFPQEMEMPPKRIALVKISIPTIRPEARTYVHMDYCAIVLHAPTRGIKYLATNGVGPCIGIAMVRVEDESSAAVVSSLSHLSSDQKDESFAKSYIEEFITQLGKDTTKINLYLVFSNQSDRELARIFF